MQVAVYSADQLVYSWSLVYSQGFCLAIEGVTKTEMEGSLDIFKQKEK